MLHNKKMLERNMVIVQLQEKQVITENKAEKQIYLVQTSQTSTDSLRFRPFEGTKWARSHRQINKRRSHANPFRPEITGILTLQDGSDYSTHVSPQKQVST